MLKHLGKKEKRKKAQQKREAWGALPHAKKQRTKNGSRENTKK